MNARWCNRMLFHFNDCLFALMNVHLEVQINDEHPISTNDFLFVLIIIVLVLMTISFLVLNSKWCISVCSIKVNVLRRFTSIVAHLMFMSD